MRNRTFTLVATFWLGLISLGSLALREAVHADDIKDAVEHLEDDAKTVKTKVAKKVYKASSKKLKQQNKDSKSDMKAKALEAVKGEAGEHLSLPQKLGTDLEVQTEHLLKK